MAHSYRVRIWSLQTRKNSNGRITSYRVRWQVGGTEFAESFKTRAQADSFRADLVSAQRRGESFDLPSGLPSSAGRTAEDMSWFDFTREYVDMKWPDLAATARQTVAESLIRVMPVFTPAGRNAPEPHEVRSALRQWGYNTGLRQSEEIPADVQAILRWCSRNTTSVRTVQSPDVLRELQRAVTRRLDGKPYAPTVARKTRSVLWNALDYAVERNLIDTNPLAAVKWTAMPKGRRKVDRRAVPNPMQARALLAAVGETLRSGPRLVAFFGAMYYAALRPEEVAALTKRNLSLPEPRFNSETGQREYGWGELHLGDANPHVGARWTDSGRPRDQRHLKSRAAGEGRAVPCPPPLTALLWEHIDTYGFGEGGLVFHGERGGEIPMITYTRVWRAARERALTAEAQTTPLARRPYDLRHAAVSTWLAAGVDPARVASWAGHSVSVLYEIYASFLDGGESAARQRIEAVLGTGPR